MNRQFKGLENHSGAAFIAHDRRIMAYVGLVAVFVVLLVIFSVPTLITLHHRWVRSGLEYGYPAVALIAIMSFIEIRRLDLSHYGRFWGLGLVLLGLCLFAVLFSRAGGIQIGSQVVFPFLLLSAIWAICGASLALRFVPILAFFYFAIPFWQILDFVFVDPPTLNALLVWITTSVVTLWIRFTGIPAHIEGDLIYLPAGIVQIAAGCSGKVYFLVALEISAFYALAFLRDWLHRLTLVFSTLVVALIANWIRVYLLVIIGYTTDMTSPLMRDHNTFGWFVFLIALAPMLLLGRYFENRESKVDRSAPTRVVDAEKLKMTAPTSASILLLAAIWISGDINAAYSRDPEAINLASVAVPGWRQEGSWDDPRTPVFVGAGASVAHWYRKDGARIGVFIAAYPVQRQGAEAIYFFNKPLGDDLEAVEAVRTRRDLLADENLAFKEYLLTKGDDRRLVWQAAQVAGRPSLGSMHAKILQALGAIRGRTDAQVLVLSISCEADCGPERQVLLEFANAAAADLIGRAVPLNAVESGASGLY
jgi:EpsI family protein